MLLIIMRLMNINKGWEKMDQIYNKLVRDNIPDIIKENGEEPIYRVLNEDEYWEYLLLKDNEELEEVRSASSTLKEKKNLLIN